MSRNHLLTALALIAAGTVGLSQLGSASEEAPAAPAAPPAIRMDEPEEASEALVHVAGAVRRPGVYRLREGMRIDDALRMAGGPTRRADLAGVNLAAKVQDGRQVLVPERNRSGSVAAAPGGPGAADGPVDLNTATLEQLDGLDGIGPATAQSIIDFREERGGFTSVEELGEVPGIGAKRMATLREAVTV